MRALAIALLVGLSLFACNPVPAGGTSHHASAGDGDTHPRLTRGRQVTAVERPTSEPLVAVTTLDKKLAVLRASTGEEVARTDTGELGGIVDLSYDAQRSTLVSYEENDEGEGAEIAAYPVHLEEGTATLGPRTRLAWVDGIARVLALPEGLVSFQENIGQRWELWPVDAEPVPSVGCPRPASVSVTRSGSEVRLVGVSSPFPGDGPPQRVEVAVENEGLGSCETSVLANAPESARLVELPNGPELLVGVESHRLTLALVGARPFDLGGPLRLDAETVEAALLLEPDLGRLAILSTGPARLTVVEVSARGGHLAIGHAGHLDLPGEVRREQQFFSREMASIGARVLVATDVGVVAVDIRNDGGGSLDLALGTFAGGNGASKNPYRGPVVAIFPEAGLR